MKVFKKWSLDSMHRQTLLRPICDDDSYFLLQPQSQPQISMAPSTKQYDPLEDLDTLESPNEHGKLSSENKKQHDKQPEKKTANSGGSWFGGLFSKLTPKPKNQMILPDDSNPTVSLDFLNNPRIHFFSLWKWCQDG